MSRAYGMYTMCVYMGVIQSLSDFCSTLRKPEHNFNANCMQGFTTYAVSQKKVTCASILNELFTKMVSTIETRDAPMTQRISIMLMLT